MIKAIVFDLGGVIFSSDGGSFESREKLARKFNINPEELQKFHFGVRKDFLCGRLSESEYLKNLVSFFNLNTPVEELKHYIRSLNVVDQEMLELVRSLAKKYLVGVLNNESKEWNEYRIAKFHLADYFSFILSSCDIGFAKPDVNAYKILLGRLSRLNINPPSALFIDDREENIRPAKRLGMKAIHFKDKNSLEDELKRLGITPEIS